jgi:hypothetical protein
MKNHNTSPPKLSHRVLFTACAAALASSVSLQAKADPVTPPPVPPEIQVQAGNQAFLKAHAFGTQDYICLPSSSGLAWTSFGPQATLFNAADRQVITHFLSPNPLEKGSPRVTWQHSQDTSTVWGQGIASSSAPAYVAPTAIPWLLVKVVGAQEGPNGGRKLIRTTFIQRVNTAGGIAPSTDCAEPADIGRKALALYEADYIFYKGY